ncbi:kinase-like domain-containing protein [Gigaspora margarita]|uniref:Kinase-like domain-containing protein n=1 Tax=Gigaspora margarita TaxID=4874 RepID=A0A8H4AFB7_GIGMA|nr:kinase-like domain-containing protein [Gigaspora margarita]
MSENEDISEHLKVLNNETKESYLARISKEGIISSFNWDEFEDSLYLSTGTSGEVLKAKWKERNKDIVLKRVASLDVTESDNQEFIKEIKAFHAIENQLNGENKEKTLLIGHNNVIKFFGVSEQNCSCKSSKEPELYLVLEYADLNNLRDYLSHNDNSFLEWEKKIDIARQVVCGLYFLHEIGILHRDLHTKNVVVKNDKTSKYGIRVMITDFGLSKVLPRNSKSSQKMSGLIQFTDPEILKEELNDKCENLKFDRKSDVYSLGVVLWEISSNGKPPFSADKRANLPFLMSFDIINGKRENPIDGSKAPYVKLYTDCWNGNPELRPETKQVFELIHQESMISGETWKHHVDEISSEDQAFYKLVETLKQQLSIEEREKVKQLNPDKMVDLFKAALQEL